MSPRRLRQRERTSHPCSVGDPRSRALPASAMSGTKGFGVMHARLRRADAMPDRWVLPRHPVLKTGVGWVGVGPRREDGVLENQIGN